MFYGLIYFLFFYKNGRQVLSPKTEKYARKKIQTASAVDQLSRLGELMKQEKIFKNPNLKLKDLADKVGISAHQLSQLLNDNLGKSFSQYINEYRVEAACKLISTHDHYTLEGIGQDVGFKSRSTFYATFKKVKGTTPAKYKEQLSSR